MSYQLFREKTYEIQQLSSISALLSWDMEVKMPKESNKSFRADQSALINGMIHQRSTSDELYKIIHDLLASQDISEIERKQVLYSKKDLERSKKLSVAFVEKYSKLTSEAYSIWEKAKEHSDFKIYESSLQKIVDLLKEKTELLGYENHPYNALLDLYEESSTVAQLDPLFDNVEKRLGVLIRDVKAKQNTKTGFLTQDFDMESQVRLNKEILDLLGLNEDYYRIDSSSHPFCTHFHPTDIRMTTRYKLNDLAGSIWSSIHESGHGRYEMGLDKENPGLASSMATSLGIHESQSRFWENNIGRSKAFIALIFPLIQKHFPKQMASANPDVLFDEINFVQPSLIRTESDELTYHYHIMIRYSIEKKLIDGSLQVKDVKEYWNETYKKYLDIDVTNDAQGVLQDVHWSFGGIGYFPTYSLGSFYAAQWYDAINKSKNITEMITSKSFHEINEWHHQNIHRHGALMTSNELCVKATGESLNFDHFENYIRVKFML